VVPPVLAGTGFSARLEVNGTPVASQNQPNTTAGPAIASVPWPGGGVNRSAVTLTADNAAAGTAPSVIERMGQWSWFKLLDAASVSPRPNGANAGWIVGGKELQYQITAGSLYNPFQLPALREFKCPTQL
jgi:type VI secretion system protein ImpL